MRAVIYCAVLLIAGAYAELNQIESEVEGLYGINDNVTILNGMTFNKTVFNSSNIWLVEFYSSWCGHCQAFAPIFKAFARDIAEWRGVYQLAVINCPDKPNQNLCASMNVKGYPIMRVFLPYATPDSKYIRVHDRKVETLRNTSVTIIDKYIDKIGWSMEGISRPTFSPMSMDEVGKFHKFDKTSFYLALVVGNDPHDIGREVILDMSSCRNITVRKFSNDSIEMMKLEAFTSISFHDLPIIIVISKNGATEEIEVAFKRRHFYTYNLQRLPGVGTPQLIPKSDISGLSKRESSYIDWKNVDRGKVYMADIESGIQYALTVEVPSSKILEDEMLDALNTFIGTLALVSEQLPVRDSTKNFLIRLTGWLAGQSQISRDDWLKRMQTKEGPSFLPQLDQRWVGCAPSKLGLRGYPCSLWTIFHSMTVAAYNTQIQECSENFVKELAKMPYEDHVFTHKDAILWLWDLHNNVNKRLHGAVSEDPNIPKVQYPSSELCPGCRNKNETWNTDNVIEHLIARFSLKSVSDDFMESKESEEENQPKEDLVQNDMKHVQNLFDNPVKIEESLNAGLDDGNVDDDNIYGFDLRGNPKILRESLKDRRKHHSLHLIKQMGSKELAKHIDNRDIKWKSHVLDMTYFDTSLCFILWGASLVSVIMMYLYLKRWRISKFASVC